MKKITLFTTLSIFLLAFSSCQEKTPAELLIGNWKMTNYESSAEKDVMEQEMFDEIKKDIIKYQSYIIEDDKVTIKSDGDDISANWAMSADQTKLEFKLPGGAKVTYDIALLTETELKLIQKDSEGIVITSSFSKKK